MIEMEPWKGLIVLGVGVLLGAVLVAGGVLMGYWIAARSRGEAHPIAGAPAAPKIEQEETD